MGYIGAHGVAALHKHKYSGVDHSYVAKYILQPFWTRCVTFFPLWMPPNMITLIGSMFLVTSASLGFIYSPHLDSPPPRWVHLAHGILLFLYQTFDAVDGKQARRTNSSSPLGELFDHGCDALACTFEALAFGSTAMCGKDTFWFWVISAVPFYGATWEHFFTNTLILPVVNGPTEGLMLIYVGHIFTAIVGAEWWVHQFGKSLPFLSWVPILSEVPTYRAVLYLMVAFAVIPTLTFNVQNVYKVVQDKQAKIKSKHSQNLNQKITKMCRGFQQSESERFLKMKAFNLVFSLAHKSCVTTFPDSLTLHYLPRINGTHLEVNHSRIKPDVPAFLTLHRVISPLSDNSVCFASREKVKASQGARFEVFFGDVRVLKGFFRKDWDDTWKMECSCGLECSSAGRILQEIVKKAEVSVVAEGGVVMNETVEIVAKRRRRRLLKGGGLEEIPEETEYCYDFADDESCSSGCSCCEELGESESESELESCGDQEDAAAAAEEEMEGEGSWAVDVGIWVMCLGVGLLVSRASSKRLLRTTTAFL